MYFRVFCAVLLDFAQSSKRLTSIINFPVFVVYLFKFVVRVCSSLIY